MKIAPVIESSIVHIFRAYATPCNVAYGLAVFCYFDSMTAIYNYD
jgi:hypothetical protein